MCECMDKYFPSSVSHTVPEGGIFLFCEMPDGYDTKAIMAKAVDRGVAFVPGSTTMIDDKAVCSSFRMNYSTASKRADRKRNKKNFGRFAERRSR